MDAEGLIGRTFIGRFRIDRVLGRGGMATVYAAFDESKGRNVALKVLKRELTRDAMVVRRFEREAKAASHLRHPNVVEVVEWGSQGEDAFIAMELAEGTDLLKALSQERPMRQGRAILVLTQVCSALAAAHAKGIVHRDLKPENILLVPDASEPGKERAKVLDFGIAKILDQPKDRQGSSNDDPPSYVTKTALTRVGTIVGTPAYMSPEQCRGGDIDGRSDIYATGVLLFQLVTGELPFSGETPLHTAMRHIHAQPRPPSELRRDLAPQLSRIILKALAKWPGERQQTAEQLRDELLDALPHVPDGKAYQVPANYCGRTPKIEDPETGTPATQLPSGGLGAVPLKAVRLGRGLGAPSAAPASTVPETLSPHTTQPEADAPPPTSAPPPNVTKSAAAGPPKDDDDDEPRTFLIQAPEATQTQPTAKAADDDPGTITREHPRTPGAGPVKTAQLTSTPAAQTAAAPATSNAPTTSKLGASPSGRSGAPTAAVTGAAPPSVAAPSTMVPSTTPATSSPATTVPRTAPLAARGGAMAPSHTPKQINGRPTSARPVAPTQEAAQAPPRALPRTIVSGEARAPEVRTVSRTERSGGRAAEPPPEKRPPQNTETGLTPTNLHPQPAPTNAAKALVASLPAPAVSPAIDADDDEPATHVREPGPPSKNARTLVMDEPSSASASTVNPALAATAPGPQNLSPVAVAPLRSLSQHPPAAQQHAQAAVQHAPSAAVGFSPQRMLTPDPHEAEALRALKATARFAGAAEEPVDPYAAVKSTVRMNPQEAMAQAGQPLGMMGAGPASQGRIPNGPPSQPMQSMQQGPRFAGAADNTGTGFRQLPTAGWTESTVVRRHPTKKPTGVFGQLRGLSGTTGLLIGIGLGLGIAAGLLIAFLLVGLGH